MNINPKTEQAYRLFHDGILTLQRAESQGLRIDVEYVQKKKYHLLKKIENLKSGFKETNFYKHWEHSSKSKVNINSHVQLAHFLYTVKKLTPEKFTDTGKGSTDEEALEKLNIPELLLLAQMHKAKKAWDVLDGFDREQVDGVLHTSFNLHLVTSFRSSSSNPNMQNVPKRDEEMMDICRKAVYPREGHQLLEVDFKGIEVAVNACINKDSTLINYVSDPSTDMHRDMAMQIFKFDKFVKDNPAHQLLRQATKNGFVFPQFYGDYYKNCAINLCDWGKLPRRVWEPGEGVEFDGKALSDHLIKKGIPSFDAFVMHLKKIETAFWGNRFVEYAAWKDLWWSLYQKYGYIDLPTGFRCQGVMDKKQACNYPGQGSAFHCLLWSLTETDKQLKEKNFDTRIVGQIHDSMLLDTHPDELTTVIDILQEITTKKLAAMWNWICVPLGVDYEICGVDESWNMKKKYTV